MSRIAFAILAGLIASSAGLGQERPSVRATAARDTSRLERVVVTASRREERLKDVVVETQLVTRDAIERSGAPDLASALQETAGLQLDGGIPAGSGVSLRGFDSRRVLVLVDGQPYVGRIAGHLDLSRIPLQNVQRIEVVRGPQSTIYGADALGGVVNIITRRPEQAGVSLSLTGGTQGRREGAASLTGASERVALRVDAGGRLSDLAPGISGDAATYARLWHGNARGVWTPGPRSSFDLAVHAAEESQRYQTGQLYRFANNTQLGVRAGAEQRRGLTRWSQTVSYSLFDHLARTSTGSRPFSDSGAIDRQSLTQLELGVTTAMGLGVVDAGVDIRDERIRADRVRGEERSAQSIEPFAQLSLQRGRVTIAPGVRASVHETWGTFVAPRLALAARATDRVTLRASLGTGYRAPDFKELYLSFANTAAGYAVEGNPDLRPERSLSASFGLHATAERWSARFTVFRNRFRDFITTSEQDAAGVFHYENIEAGTTHGVESELTMSLGASRVDLGYDYTATRERDSGAPFPGISPHQARLAFTAPPIAGASLTLATHYSAATPLQAIAAGSLQRERGAYARSDLRISRPIGPQLRARGGVSNIFDRTLGDGWPGFTGRQIFAGLDWTATR